MSHSEELIEKVRIWEEKPKTSSSSITVERKDDSSGKKDFRQNNKGKLSLHVTVVTTHLQALVSVYFNAATFGNLSWNALMTQCSATSTSRLLSAWVYYELQSTVSKHTAKLQIFSIGSDWFLLNIPNYGKIRDPMLLLLVRMLLLKWIPQAVPIKITFYNKLEIRSL